MLRDIPEGLVPFELIMTRKRFYLKDTTKTSIENKEISCLLNTNLGN